MTRVLELFAGAGLWASAWHESGAEHVGLAEIEPFPRRVLEMRFPGVPLFGDVRELHGSDLPACDIVVASPPCQPASVAGQREGVEDPRWLWPDTIRIAREVEAPILVAENPAGIMTLDKGAAFLSILDGLHRAGYSTVEWDHLPACAFGQPHRRDRVFIVARREGWTFQDTPGAMAHQDTMGNRPQDWTRAGAWLDGVFYARTPRWPIVEKPDPLAMWQTPSARDWKDGRASEATHEGNARPLNEVASHWPTPRASESENRQRGHSPSHGDTHGEALAGAVTHWPTPCGQDGPNGGPSQGTDRLPGCIAMPVRIDGGMLAPGWTENLLGIASGWTDPTCESPVPTPGPVFPRVIGMDGASPQWPGEPPRTVKPAKGDNRSKRLAAIGNGVDAMSGRAIASVVVASMRRKVIA